ncbi:MAG: RNA-binding S4 domain-containing protein [Lachnospiraceae bacterium]|nr:RNA-binding S4 domain-containing protein [Lachnospiraceae bacterium]MCQ2544507.1 RNA-binding S4 domain-containing protein [Lachnospiraceae bacterium]
MRNVTIRDEFIKLGQALKLAGFVDTGVDAKLAVQDGYVKVNGEVETQRGKKLYDGDIAEYNGQQLKIVAKKV